MTEKIAKFIEENEPAIRVSPFKFAGAFLLGIAVGAGVAVFIMMDRLAAKSDQIDSLSRTLGLIPTEPNHYAKLPPEELQRLSLKLVANLRHLVDQDGIEQGRIIFLNMAKPGGPVSEESRKRDWLETSARSQQQGAKLISEYSAKYKVEANLLREEIQNRLSVEQKAGKPPAGYEFAVNGYMISQVADDLEKLAKKLN